MEITSRKLGREIAVYASASIEAEVMAVLRHFADAYSNRDKERLLELFLPDRDVILLGSGQDERCVGPIAIWDQIRREWDQIETARLRFGWRSVSLMGQVAWLATDCYAYIESGYRKAELPLRITAVMLEHEGQWKIAQLHYSSPVRPEEEVDTCLE